MGNGNNVMVNNSPKPNQINQYLGWKKLNEKRGWWIEWAIDESVPLIKNDNYCTASALICVIQYTKQLDDI